MKKNKLNKGKRVGYALMGLSAVALIGVGFSTWVVQIQDTKETGNVTVDVADVQDQTLKIELGGTSGVVDGNIRFDAPKSDNSGPIQFAGEGDGEDLEFKIEFSIDMADNQVQYFNGVTVQAGGDNLATIQGWITNNWITAPMSFDGNTPGGLIDSTWTAAGDHYLAAGKSVDSQATWDTHVNVALSGTKRTYAVTCKFGWGSAFSGKNPSLHDDADENANASLTALKAFKAAASQTTFKLTLKHDPQASGKVTISA